MHGWGGSSDSWCAVQKILANNGYKVIVLDLPGFGKSVTPKIPWGITEYSNFVLDFIREIKLENFCLLGHSFGGRVAIRFSKDHPELVNKLVLCDAAGIKMKPDFKTMMILLVAKIGNGILSPKPLARFRDSARSFFYSFIRHRDYVKADDTMKETLKKVLNEDLLLDIPKIQEETLIVWGAEDKMLPVKYARVFKKEIKNSRLEILPGIGHGPHLEVPENYQKLSSIF